MATALWIYMRDPLFAESAGVALDLYQRIFLGRRLRPDEYVICAAEKPAANVRPPPRHAAARGPQRPARYEFEYERGGTLACIAAWDVHHANLFDRVEQTTESSRSAVSSSRS